MADCTLNWISEDEAAHFKLEIYLLFILTSERVHRTLFAGRNHTFQRYKFNDQKIILTSEGMRSTHSLGKIHNIYY